MFRTRWRCRGYEHDLEHAKARLNAGLFLCVSRYTTRAGPRVLFIVQCPLHFRHFEGLYVVAYFDVVEVLDAQATLVTVRNLLGIVLESFEVAKLAGIYHDAVPDQAHFVIANDLSIQNVTCLLYTSDAADERSSVDLGGRRLLKKKTKYHNRDGLCRRYDRQCCS